jgi:hypothetical protein
MIRSSAVQLRPRKLGPKRTAFTYFDVVAEQFAKPQEEFEMVPIRVFLADLDDASDVVPGGVEEAIAPATTGQPNGHDPG